jgi:hypothetical protein
MLLAQRFGLGADTETWMPDFNAAIDAFRDAVHLTMPCRR